MDYSTVLSRFSACMTEIGNALRKINGTTKKYKFTEIASAINECTQVYYLGTGTSFNVSNIPDYQNLTKDNFIVEAISASGYGSCYGSSGSPSSTIIKTYDSTSGKLTITGNSASDDKDGSSFHHVSYNIVIGVYLVKGKIKQL